MRLYNKIQVLKLLNQHLNVYPTPMNLNWNWSWGSLSGLILGSQIVTGILLAMHYVGHVDHAFASVQHLMVDVPSGLILRYAHANGASLFFTVVYLHILRGLYYSSGNQPREILWISGVVILLLMIITAFIGYVLPWGQMSFWGLSYSPKCLSFLILVRNPANEVTHQPHLFWKPRESFAFPWPPTPSQTSLSPDQVWGERAGIARA
jgi:quinol-cytochrome oxidoreductase complex cytochrome b subunit